MLGQAGPDIVAKAIPTVDVTDLAAHHGFALTTSELRDGTVELVTVFAVVT